MKKGNREGNRKRMKVIGFAGLVLSVLLLALCSIAQAQQAGKIFHIGFLDPSTAASMAVLACEADEHFVLVY